jgi:flagellar assembly protein FliH
LIDQAQAEAAAIRSLAFDEGHEAGRVAGLAAAEERIAAQAAEMCRQQLQTAISALQALVSSLEIEREGWRAQWESAAIRLSAAMAEKIIRRELSQNPQIAGDLIGQALQLAAGRPQIKVRLNPQDLAELESCGGEIEQCLARLDEGALAADGDVSRGGCVVESLHGRIDARIETQLHRIMEELAEEL